MTQAMPMFCMGSKVIRNGDLKRTRSWAMCVPIQVSPFYADHALARSRSLA